MSPAHFETALVASLALCAAGALWRIAVWLRRDVGPDARDAPPLQRLRAAPATLAAALAGRRALRFAGTFCLDALLLRRLFAQHRLRASAHLAVVVGFTLLVALHALAPLVTARLFPGYQPTLAPWLGLRNALGATALLGLALLVAARARAPARAGLPRPRLAAAFATLLALVLVSGFLLEAHKIASPRAFDRMAAQFAAGADPAELASLRALWAREYGVAFDSRSEPVAPSIGEAGRRLHETACAACHASPRAAFVSWPLARAMAPLTAALDALHAEAWLLHLHVLACLLGLATLPFTTFFHALAAPASLLADAAARHRGAVRPVLARAAQATRRALAPDACVRCGECDVRCSVAPLARVLGNPALLPAHKLAATGAKARTRGDRRDDRPDPGTVAIADGAFLCTDCGRCTRACPVGLDLADLWEAGRADLAAAGLPATTTWVQARPAAAWAEALARRGGAQPPADATAACAPLSHDRQTFARCVQCQTCTNVCPVVAHGMEAGQDIDLTPQKVMNLLRLGLPDLALGSRMVWSCATCYQCQQHCPEGIRIADIMCELRALAVARLGAVRGEGA